ncbi:hypothetical protein E3P99_02500 [Wallemia hederae]|uniref:CN hydrolase domain-containing protein n=1 Tax=Wallemia hederae TaxID=1540922 RepID=A0A4T0FM91_9BASI|nr:hypothetical protein E3P99_02500 [Wallemia hederae]
MRSISEIYQTIKRDAVHSPNYILLGGSAIVSVFALGPLPNIAIILLLSKILMTTFINTPYRRYLIPQALLLAVGTSLSYLRQVHSATGRTNVVEILLLFTLSLFTTIIALLPLQDLTWNSHLDHVRISLFPLAWATVWALFESFSSIGRQGSWTPLGSFLDRLLPFTGQFGIDFAVASLSLIVATAGIQGYETLSKTDGDIDSHEQPDESAPLIASERPTTALPSLKKASLALSKVLIAFVVIVNIFSPRIRQTEPSNSLSVACVRPQDGNFMKESQRLLAHANVLLWPEARMEVHDDKEKHELLDQVMKILQNNKRAYVGVTFKQRRKGKSTNELLWVTHDGVDFEYSKKNVVPIAESFSTSPGLAEAPISTIPLPLESIKHTDAIPLSVSSGICFDGAFPMRHADLQLFPARTWDPIVAEQMYQLTKARARESSSALLWCDGGDSGLSAAVDDQGYEHMLERGGASSVARLPFSRGKDRVESRNMASVLGRVGVAALFYAGYLLAYHRRLVEKLKWKERGGVREV